MPLRIRATDDRETYLPVHLDPRADRERIEALANDDSTFVHDTITQQLTELVVSRRPDQEMDDAARRRAIEAELDGRDASDYGAWVHYPWSRRLVHVLPEPEYRFMRGSRNRYKIEAQEEATLRGKTLGVVGLSVGLASVTTLAMEGVGGRFRLADFDALDLSNMNRLRAGVHEIGVRKVYIAARTIAEIDPYLHVEIFPNGIDEENAGAFLGDLDLLVEECDDLYMKIRLRELARARKIPVIMETSDRGLLDVERFDLEPERPILHGLVGSIRSDKLKGLTTKEKVPYVLRIIDERSISLGLAASLVEVKQSISTWPQLASSVALGGAVVTDTARRLLLGHFTESGRYYVDPELVVASGKAIRLPEGAPLDPQPLPEATAPRTIAKPPPGRGAPTEDEIRWVVEHAVLAPSGGNVQPWRFRYKDDLRVYLDASASFLDFENAASLLAIGAAAENLDLAARAIGLLPTISAFPEASDPALVFRASFVRGEPREPERLAQVTERVTNRRRDERIPLRSEHRGRLDAVAKAAGASLRLYEEPATLARIAQVLGEGDRLRFLCRPLHRELISELRWTADETLQTRDGIDVATLEVTTADAAAMRVLANWPTMQKVRAIDGGRALADGAKKTIAASSAVGLLGTSATTRAAFFDGGRVLERVWLEATSCGLAFQPYTPLLYLFRRLDVDACGDLERVDRDRLAVIRDDLVAVLGELPPTPLMLFRLGYAGPPRARSLRRPLTDVLRFGV